MSGDYFYLPPEAFQNPDFQRGLKLFLSPDGKAARFIITHDADPATPAGIAAVKPELSAAHQAVKGTTLTGARFSSPEPRPSTATFSRAPTMIC